MLDRRGFLALATASALTPSLSYGASAADLTGDIAILRQALTLHPGLYRYNSPRAMAARIDRLALDFPSAATTEARYLLLSRFLATIRCGHSYANFFNQKKAVADALFDRPTRVPFHFVWIGDQMVVTADHSGIGALPRGTLITRLNGIRPSAMRAALLPYIRADGSNDGKRISLLEVRGDDAIETFDVFQGLLFPPSDGVHRLKVVEPGQREKTIALPANNLAQRRAGMTSRVTSDDVPQWTWRMGADDIALLTMPGWGLWQSKWNWRTWLDERLNSLGAAKGIIIDIRDNEGGDDCGDPILARLTATDLRDAGAEQKLRFQRTPAAIDRYLDTWDDSFRTLGVGGAALPGGFFARPGASDIMTIAAKSPRLTVPVAILTSAVNSSATFQFAYRAQRNGLAKLYGGTTGGNRRGINGGSFFFVRLPASGLEFDLPLVGYFPAGPQPDAGLAPDAPITATLADVIAGRDPVMARARADLLRA